MNREIKFRAWDEGNRIMHYVFQFIRSGDEGNDWIIFVSDKFPLTNHKTNPFENPNPYFAQQLKIMEYTGLKDKNGKEIYEGDIVEMKIEYAEYEGQNEDEWKVWYEKGKVEFSSGCFWINTNGHSINCHFHYNDSHREVIGNIYENKPNN